MNHHRPSPPILRPALLAATVLLTLSLTACDKAPEPQLQATGSAILDREMPATVAHVDFYLGGGLLFWQQQCAIGVTASTRIEGKPLPAYLMDNNLEVPYGPSRLLWVPEHEFSLSATKTGGHWRIDTTGLSPDTLTAAQFEASVRDCVAGLNEWMTEESLESGDGHLTAEERANRRSWDTVPPAPPAAPPASSVVATPVPTLRDAKVAPESR